MKTARDTKRQERDRNSVPSVAIAGYTNAGKSSLLNRLTGAGVLVEDALFATLDPTVRKAQTPSGREFTLSDTVGFVRLLPHQLVEAFRSTLEEVSGADLILHVVDGSHPDPRASSRPYARSSPTSVRTGSPRSWSSTSATWPTRWCSAGCSAASGTSSGVCADRRGPAELLQVLEDEVPHPDTLVHVLLPYSAGGLVSRIHGEGEVLVEEHTEHGTRSRRGRSGAGGGAERLPGGVRVALRSRPGS
jgi:GTP-binding protein HflX